MNRKLLTPSQVLEQAVPVRSQTCAIYFLIRDREVVYVGKSTHVDARLAAHVKNMVWRPFDSWTEIPCLEEEADQLEAAYIERFDPPYNADSKTRTRRAEAERARHQSERTALSPDPFDGIEALVDALPQEVAEHNRAVAVLTRAPRPMPRRLVTGLTITG